MLAGGLISLFVTWLLVKYGIGLQPPCAHHAAADIETGGQNLAMDNRNMDMDVSAEPGDGSALNRQALPGGTGTDVAGRSTPQQNTHNTAQVETSCQPDRAESSSVKALACATDCSVAGCGSPTTSVFTKTAQAACKCCCVTTHHHQHCCHGPEPLMSPFELYCTRPPAEEHVMLEASQQCSASSSSSSAASPATDNVPVRAGCLDDCNRVQSLPSELLARAATASAATIQGALGGTATSAYLFTCQPSTPTKQSMVSCHNPEDAAGATNTLQLQLNAQNERSCAIITAEAVHDQPQHPRSTGGQATGDHPVVSGKDKVGY